MRIALCTSLAVRYPSKTYACPSARRRVLLLARCCRIEPLARKGRPSEWAVRVCRSLGRYIPLPPHIWSALPSAREPTAEELLQLPASFDERNSGLACGSYAIVDQGSCGSCWAFAGARVYSDRMCRATNARWSIALSEQHMVQVCACACVCACVRACLCVRARVCVLALANARLSPSACVHAHMSARTRTCVQCNKISSFYIKTPATDATITQAYKMSNAAMSDGCQGSSPVYAWIRMAGRPTIACHTGVVATSSAHYVTQQQRHRNPFW